MREYGQIKRADEIISQMFRDKQNSFHRTEFIRRGRDCRPQHLKEDNMKGYTTDDGFMGFVNGSYMLFVSENEYFEYVESD